MNFRIGQGIDTHQLVGGNMLMIGGVSIPFNKGFKGHSDGDILLHAIVDALLGASSQGDIGTHFPSSDDKWKGVKSNIFLAHTISILNELEYKIHNIDSTIILQKPFLRDYIPLMKKNITGILDIDEDLISIKATTSDYLGFCGRGEGATALATVLLSKDDFK